MTAWLIGALRWMIGSRAGVAVLTAAALLLVLVPLILVARHDLESERQENEQLRDDLRVSNQNVERLRQAVDAQNERIDELRAERERITDQAAQAARDVLDQADEERAQDADAGNTPEDMNRWIRGLFDGS